ncbi:hypothetical protein B0A49_09374 [Cryomyces minteri]|uniref:BZIP domain-containing protein n=1 Tax=Cryomyces minteri TaxID=331657 RepID=A0A4U0WGA5_9PEZI|nr:hypothetical protein B0A49_09399 [Cryomyces minteri]TKA62045.1 hypothetical protein B0A49_09374 [Cryomyces minteri]
MAATHYHRKSSMPPPIKSDFDPDMDSLFDFNQGGLVPSPTTTRSSSRAGPTPRLVSAHPSQVTAHSPLFDVPEDRQVFSGPSHEYERFRQQTGIPVGTVANLAALNQPIQRAYPEQNYNGYSMGMGNAGLNSGIDSSWSSGIDLDIDMNLDLTPTQGLPPYFYPSGDASQSDNFIDPSAIGGQEEVPSNVGRLWPGMHQQQAQQAAIAKAQAQAQQQRQQHYLRQQQQQKRAEHNHQSQQFTSQSRSRASSQLTTDPHTEESIARLLNQMRHNSTVSSADDAMSPGGSSVLPHIARMRKEEEDMDEDERLLASEEGKKLSSKERRQLRNKVSARAFRSRRKEYIGQLEGEVAMKTNECNGLKTENRSLMEENARYRGLIQTLLRHPAFTPFINDLSNDATVTAPASQSSRSVQPTPNASAPQQEAPSYLQFDASQLQIPQQNDDAHVGLAMIPETPVDLSMLNLENNRLAIGNQGFGFQQPQVYSVLELPEGPSPLELHADILSGKGGSDLSTYIDADKKADYPSIENMPSFEPVGEHSSAAVSIATEDDAAFSLYTDSPSTTFAMTASETHGSFSYTTPEKSSLHFELVVSDDLASRKLERMCARLDPALERIAAMTAYLGL